MVALVVSVQSPGLRMPWLNKKSHDSLVSICFFFRQAILCLFFPGITEINLTTFKMATFTHNVVYIYDIPPTNSVKDNLNYRYPIQCLNIAATVPFNEADCFIFNKSSLSVHELTIYIHLNFIAGTMTLRHYGTTKRSILFVHRKWTTIFYRCKKMEFSTIPKISKFQFGLARRLLVGMESNLVCSAFWGNLTI